MTQAADLARFSNAELHILGIVVTTGSLTFAQGDGSIDFLRIERNRIQQAIETAATELSGQSVNVAYGIREGDPRRIMPPILYRQW